MASVNKAILIGHLGRDPEVRYLPSGDALANLSLATTETWVDKQTGQRQESTEWHRISLFGKTAEVAGQYLKKGTQVYIEGSIRTRKWQDKEGQDRYTTEVRGDRMVMLGSKSGGSMPLDNTMSPSEEIPPAPRRMEAAPAKAEHIIEDDIPF